MISLIASVFAPLIVTLTALIMVFSKKTSVDDFLLGTHSGISTCFSLLPTLIMLVVSVSMLSASGFIDILSGLFEPLFAKLGVPSEALPLILIRPFSGSGSNAVLAEMFEKYGADSLASRFASVLIGSSDTVIYVISVYFSAVGVKKTRHAIPAAFITMLFCVFFSSFICRLFFG